MTPSSCVRISGDSKNLIFGPPSFFGPNEIISKGKLSQNPLKLQRNNAVKTTNITPPHTRLNQIRPPISVASRPFFNSRSLREKDGFPHHAHSLSRNFTTKFFRKKLNKTGKIYYFSGIFLENIFLLVSLPKRRKEFLLKH